VQCPLAFVSNREPPSAKKVVSAMALSVCRRSAISTRSITPLRAHTFRMSRTSGSGLSIHLLPVLTLGHHHQPPVGQGLPPRLSPLCQQPPELLTQLPWHPRVYIVSRQCRSQQAPHPLRAPSWPEYTPLVAVPAPLELRSLVLAPAHLEP
jgi:hypothetical protein